MPKSSPAKSKARATKTTAAKSTAKKPAAKKPAAKPKSPKAKPAAKKAGKKPAAGEQEVTLDRRAPGAERRQADDAASTPAASSPAASSPAADLKPREKVNRRRQIDPTTCERDYTGSEVEFMNAMDDYKRRSGRMFPTCSEVLEVIRSLGYVQLTPAELAAREATLGPDEQPSAESFDADRFDEESVDEEEALTV